MSTFMALVAPSLEVVAGMQAGRIFHLSRDHSLLGRSDGCDVILSPRTVSRRHAVIERRGRGFTIRDLGSTRGTFVGNVRVGRESVSLENGAMIRLGDLVLIFHCGEVRVQDEDTPSTSVLASIDVASAGDTRTTVVKPREKLRALLKINRDLACALDLNDVLDRTLASLFEIFPLAERGFILLPDPNDSEPAPTIVRSRSGLPGPLSISRTILNRVLNDGYAILSGDVAGEFPDSRSAAEGQIRSLLCAPLLDDQRQPIGIIQIDTFESRGRFEQDDLDLLVAVAGQIGVAIQNARLHKALLNQRELERDLQFARRVMQTFLPKHPVTLPDYDFWDYYEPARQLGGDYYGYLPLDDPELAAERPSRRWAVGIGDVMGKGLPAALHAAKLSAEVRLFLSLEPDPTQVVSRLNRYLQIGGTPDVFITFLLVILDLDTSRIVAVNAGHPPPLIRRGETGFEELADTDGGLPLAVSLDSNYPASDSTLGEQDVLILYTDGVTDAMNIQDERFGLEGLIESARSATGSASSIGEAIRRDLRRHTAGRELFDDITLICLGRHQPETQCTVTAFDS
jgi:serine phosphatase RsbU (regulator of sigma subunit)